MSAPGRGRPPITAVGVLVVLLLAAAVLRPAGSGPVAGLVAGFAARTDNGVNTFAAAATFPTYPQAVLADNPVGYYRQDDAAGATAAADSSGTGNTGVYVSPLTSFQAPGSPAGGSSTADTALRLNAGGTGVAAADTALSSPDTWTAEVWFRTTNTVAQRLLQFADTTSGATTTTDRIVAMTAAGRLSLVVGTTTVTSSAAFNDGAWHLVTASLGAAGAKLYVDGGPVAADTTVTAGTTVPTGYWRLGGDPGQYFTGTLDEAAVFTTQLGDGRVAAHYGAGAGATTLGDWTSAVTADGPWALWHLDDAPLTVYQGSDVFATAMADSGGQGHRGTYRNVRPAGLLAGGAGALVASQAGSTSVRFRGSGFGYDPATYANPAAWSEELWFRSTSTTGGVLFQFTSQAATYPSTYDRSAFLTDTGRITYGVYTSGIQTVTTTASYTDGAWHHVVGTGGPAGLALYVDGALVAANAAVTAGENTSGHFRWGGGNTANWTPRPSGDYVVGDIDEVAFYLTQLTAQQVAWHYHANH